MLKLALHALFHGAGFLSRHPNPLSLGKRLFQTTTLSFKNIHEHGLLFSSMLQARQHKPGQIEWQNYHQNGDHNIYDQYDTPAARWVVFHTAEGEVLAGARIVPTTAKCGTYSYMIRDAQRDLLSNIPSNVLYYPAPASEEIWEASWLFIKHHTAPGLKRAIYCELLRQVQASLRVLEATHFVILLRASWPLWARTLQGSAQPLGPIIQIEDKKQQVVQISVS